MDFSVHTACVINSKHQCSHVHVFVADIFCEILRADRFLDGFHELFHCIHAQAAALSAAFGGSSLLVLDLNGGVQGLTEGLADELEAALLGG